MARRPTAARSPTSPGPSGSCSRTPTSSSSSAPWSGRCRSARATWASPPPAIAERVTSSLAAVGLLDERATNPYDLDLSRRKLVALAGVLAMDPAVLVLDEPTTGQDADGVGRVGAVVEAMRAAGRTVVAITHDMEFAATAVRPRSSIMRDGVVVADGPPERVFAPAGARSPGLDRADAAAGRQDRRPDGARRRAARCGRSAAGPQRSRVSARDLTPGSTSRPPGAGPGAGALGGPSSCRRCRR